MSEIISIEDILPKEGLVYPVRSGFDAIPLKAGAARFLWQPPYIELNGWLDRRPSEVLKTFVLEGELSNPTDGNLQFDFLVTNRCRLVEKFDQLEEDLQPPFSKCRHSIQGVAGTYWANAEWIFWSQVGSYTILSALGDYGVQVAIIFSRHGSKMCVHYSSTEHESFTDESVVTKYYMNSAEQKHFETLIGMGTEKYDDTLGSLPVDKIHGV